MKVRLTYPLERGRIVLRTDADWDRDVEPVAVTEAQTIHEFELPVDRPVIQFKPCLIEDDELHWASGTNEFLLPRGDEPFEVRPHFFSQGRGRITPLIEIPSELGRARRVRIYLPAGYDENTLRRYPVLYMHDGKNLFIPEESFTGSDWQIDSTMNQLDAMNLIRRTIVVGIHTSAREFEYTQPGYEAYGSSILHEIKPWVDARYRTLDGPDNTCVMGSSLGGVVSFYLAWRWPETFGNAACLSSTFHHFDDLFERVRNDPIEPRRNLRIYLDSGWPRDNYDVTLSMAALLVSRGFVLRSRLHALCVSERGAHRAGVGRTLPPPDPVLLGPDSDALGGVAARDRDIDNT